MDTDLNKDVYRPAEVAAILGVRRNSVYRWLRAGIFTRVRIGGATFIRGSELRTHLHSKPDVIRAPAPPAELSAEAEEMLLSFRNRRRS